MNCCCVEHNAPSTRAWSGSDGELPASCRPQARAYGGRRSSRRCRGRPLGILALFIRFFIKTDTQAYISAPFLADTLKSLKLQNQSVLLYSYYPYIGTGILKTSVKCPVSIYAISFTWIISTTKIICELCLLTLTFFYK